MPPHKSPSKPEYAGAFAVFGFKPERIQAAQDRHIARRDAAIRAREQAKSLGIKMPRLPPEFHLRSYALAHKPTPYCRSFASRQAAFDTAELLRKHGWVEVHILDPEGVLL